MIGGSSKTFFAPSACTSAALTRAVERGVVVVHRRGLVVEHGDDREEIVGNSSGDGDAARRVPDAVENDLAGYDR